MAAENLVTRKQLAAAMHVNPDTILRWIDQGAPVAVKGGQGVAHKFYVSSMKAWVAQRAASVSSDASELTRQRARREAAGAKLAEQTYEIRRGEWIRQDEVDRMWGGEVNAVRRLLLAVPSTHGDSVMHVALTEGIVGVRRVLKEAMYTALRQLAAPERPIEE